MGATAVPARRPEPVRDCQSIPTVPHSRVGQFKNIAAVTAAGSEVQVRGRRQLPTAHLHEVMSDPKDVADGVAEMSLSQRKKMEKMKKIQEQKAAKQAAKAAAAAATPTQVRPCSPSGHIFCLPRSQAGTKQANEVPALVLDTSLPPATEVRVVDVHKHTGQRVKVFAWVQYVRDQVKHICYCQPCLLCLRMTIGFAGVP